MLSVSLYDKLRGLTKTYQEKVEEVKQTIDETAFKFIITQAEKGALYCGYDSIILSFNQIMKNLDVPYLVTLNPDEKIALVMKIKEKCIAEHLQFEYTTSLSGDIELSVKWISPSKEIKSLSEGKLKEPIKEITQIESNTKKD